MEYLFDFYFETIGSVVTCNTDELQSKSENENEPSSWCHLNVPIKETSLYSRLFPEPSQYNSANSLNLPTQQNRQNFWA